MRVVGIVIPLEEKSATRLIEPLTTLVAADMALVNQTILSRTGSAVTMIPEVANHLIASGGKRLRPILTLATAGVTARDVQLDTSSLEDAFVKLTGRHLHTEGIPA